MLEAEKPKPWTPAEILPPGKPLDVIVAQFMGHEVKSLFAWGEQWYPAVEDRMQLYRGVWTVSDGDGMVEMEYKPGVEGEWSLRHIESFSAEILFAWPVYERILRDYDETVAVQGKSLLLWADYMGPREIITGNDAAHAICLGAKYIWDRGLRPR